MGLGERLKDARKRAGLSQVEVAAKSGVAQTTVSKLERGELDADEAVAVVRYASVLAAVGLSPGAPPTAPETPQEPAQSVEDAVGRAFAPGRHRAGDVGPVLAEAASVLAVLGEPSPERDALLVECAGLWLDAAAELRSRGLAVTIRTLLAQTTVLAVLKNKAR